MAKVKKGFWQSLFEMLFPADKGSSVKKRTSTKSVNKKSPSKKSPGKKDKKRVPVGRTVMVKNSHINKTSNKPEERRTHVVIDTNKDDLALVRLTTKKPNTTRLKYYKQGNSYFKHFVEIEDVKGNPLRIGENITQNHKNMDLSKSDISHIYSTISNSKQKDLFDKNMANFRNRYKE